MMKIKMLSLLAAIAGFSLFFAAPSFATDAETNYKVYCVQCHGISGNGKGVNTWDMSVQPRDHSDAKGMKSISDKDMFKAIKEGGLAVSKSVHMPPWGDILSDEDIHDIVKYLRELCNCKPGT